MISGQENLSERELSTKGFTCAATAFSLMGFTSTCWGSMLPWLAKQNNLSISQTGIVFAGFTLFTLVGTSSAQFFGQKKDLIWFIRYGILIALLGFLGVVFLSTLPVLIFSACGAGFGYGAIGLSLLQLITRSSNATHVRMNIASAATGCGALAGPFTIGILGTQNIPLIIILAMVCSAIATQILPNANWRVERIIYGKQKVKTHLNLVITLLGVIFYSGVENSIGAWLPTIIKSQSGSLESGAFGSALFYLFFSVGRFIGIGISRRVSAERIIIFSIFGAFVPLIVLTLTDKNAFYALAVSGLFLGPIFPNASSWIAGKTPGFPLATTALMLSIMSGGLIFPVSIGFFLENFGPSIFILLLIPLLLFSSCCFLYSYLNWRD